MILDHTEMRIRISPERARVLGESLINFAETCEKEIHQTFATSATLNEHFSIQLIWEPKIVNGEILNLKSIS